MGLLWPPMRPRRCLPGPVRAHMVKLHVHASLSSNQAIPPPSPAHTGHCARPGPSPTRENGMGKRARGLTVIPSAYSGRREALTPQYRASQSPTLAASDAPTDGDHRGSARTHALTYTLLRPRLRTAVLSRGLYNHRKKRESESRGASQSHISASAVVV